MGALSLTRFCGNPRRLQRVAMRFRPGDECHEWFLQRPSQWRDRILDSDRGRRNHTAVHQPVAFEPAQGLGQRLVRDRIQAPFDGIETRRLLTKNGQDQHLPLVGNLFQHRLGGVDLLKDGIDCRVHGGFLLYI